MVEGTLAGLGAGIIATGKVEQDKSCSRAPVLELRNEDNELIDIALVDLAVVDARDTGARAIWDPTSIRELFLTRAHPAEIGLSSIGGWLDPITKPGEAGLYIQLGDEGTTQLSAPIAPGLITPVKVITHRRFDESTPLPISYTPSTIALDGEREVVLRKGDKMTVHFNRQGPLVVNLEKTLVEAAKAGLMNNITT